MTSPRHLTPPRLTLAATLALTLVLPLAGCALTGQATVTRATPSSRVTPTPRVTPIIVPTVTPGLPNGSQDGGSPELPGGDSERPDAGPPPAISAPYAMLINTTTGTVYLSVSADTPVPMASTTKIMTALVALSIGQPDQVIRVGPDASGFDPTYASLAGLRQGERFTLQELLYALLVPSGDDAAVAIADGVAGSQERFVALMNEAAALFGLSHTRYADVHGLDIANHYTTARDLGRLASIAMRSPIFAQIVATSTYRLSATPQHRDYVWHTTNELLSDMAYPGATGIKTGFTGAAGRCLVFSATRPYAHLLGVLLDEPGDPTRFTDAIALLDWGFARALSSAHPRHQIPH